MMIINFVSSVH